MTVHKESGDSSGSEDGERVRRRIRARLDSYGTTLAGHESTEDLARVEDVIAMPPRDPVPQCVQLFGPDVQGMTGRVPSKWLRGPPAA